MLLLAALDVHYCEHQKRQHARLGWEHHLTIDAALHRAEQHAPLHERGRRAADLPVCARSAPSASLLLSGSFNGPHRPRQLRRCFLLSPVLWHPPAVLHGELPQCCAKIYHQRRRDAVTKPGFCMYGCII